MKIKDLADEIIVINLEKRKDRLENCLEQSKKYNFSFTRIEAIAGEDVENSRGLRLGEYALLLSHKKAIEYCSDKNLKKALILEDDFQFYDDTEERLEEFNLIPDDWEVVYLGANHYNLGAGSIPPEKINGGIIRIFTSFTTHALLINQSCFPNILKILENPVEPLDVCYLDIQKNKKCYSFSKSICKQYDSYSDIIYIDPQYNKRGLFD